MFKFDGKHASEYFDKVLLVKRDMAAPSSPILQELRDKPGAYFFGVQTGVYEVEFEVFIQGNDRQDLWKRIRKANAWLKQGELKRLEFDDEPDLYYEAVCVDNLELDEILEYGFGTIKFIAPDPYAFGETQKQRISSPTVVFSRPSVRYRENGTAVTENYPMYKDGKFGQAVFIEEGTTNLLTTAASPSQEEVSVDVGVDYYLSTIGGSATIEHKQTETLSKTTLNKEGTDYSHELDTEWETGTHNDTQEVSNDYLQLTSGTDYEKIWDSDEEWNDSSNTMENVGGYGGGLELYGYPDWDLIDYMTYFRNSGWETRGDNVFSQEPDHLFFNASSPVSQQTRVFRALSEAGFNYATLDFKASINGNHMKVWLTNGSNAWRVFLPSTNGEVKWFRIRFNPSGATLYVDGVQTSTTVQQTTSTSNILQFYIQNAGESTVMRLYFVFFSYRDEDAPPAGHWYTGTWETPYMSLAQVKGVETASLSWFYEYTNTNLDDAGISIDYQLRVNGVEQGWKTLFNDATQEGDITQTIPDLPNGTNVMNTEIKLRIVLSSRSPFDFPYVDYLRLYVKSGYSPAGSWESPVLDISQVGKAATTSISWVSHSVPTGTSVKVETNLSLDGGDTWEGFVEVDSGDSIPGITQTTNLANARLRYKITLTTTDATVTPSVDSVEINLVSGYKPSETIELNGFEVSNIGFAETSVVSLPENSGNESTSVIFEYSIDDGQTWNELVDSQPFIQNEDLTGKLLRLRYTLSTSDTRFSPSIGNSLTWYIQQQEQNKIKPATQTIRVTPSGVTRWQLEKKPYPTGWHATGTRYPESMSVWIEHLVESWEIEGAISFWFHDDGVVKQQFPTILDTVGDTYRIKVYKDVANDEYVLEIGGNVVLATPASIGWNHLVLTWDESNGYLYLNNSLVETFDKETFPLRFNGMNEIWLGSSRDETDQINDLIDDISLWDHKLDEEEIDQLYQEPAQSNSGANIYHLDGSLTSTDDRSLVYEGTAETFPKFTITFARDTSYYRVANGRDFVLVNYDFKAGDVLEIDNQRELILLNGGPIMKAISLDSDFFEIRNGDEIIVDPAGFANVDIEFVERWV